VTAARAGAESLAARRAEAQRVVEACDRALAARRSLEAAEAWHAEVARAAGSAAADGGFADLAAAAAAALDEVQTARLEAALKAHDDEAAAVADRERQPEDAGPLPPAPDLAALATAEELARADDQDAANRMALCAGALDAVVDLEGRLRELLEATAPLARRHRTLAELCRCLDGTGGDNTKRMSLSAYVLASRLEQVAEAASVRLSAMSGGRYGLVHSDTSGLGRGRSGLSLKVVDGWTGRQRDTATLSGGESFYTSLALALGLADVVSAEAGGTTIETLFVDEGFGTLDEETLDEVMDVLDGLRSGGRAVGVVSHVPDLRTRIPARLEVLKTRTGSTVRQASA
jgi:exonuclease SbcC